MPDRSRNGAHHNPPPIGGRTVGRVAVVTCAVLDQEIEHFAASLEHLVHVEVLERGLHNEPDRLRAELQQAIDRIEADTPADAIVLGYGLCSRGTEGIMTKRCLLVVPRAHDCITLLLGCKKRYAEYVARHPGTYWYSPGWIRHNTMPGKQRYEDHYQQYVQKYGQDNADFLMQTEQQWMIAYERAAYVDLGVSDTQQDEAYTRSCAAYLNWTYDRQHGDPALLKALLAGDWNDDDFLVLQPGQTLRLTADDRIIEAVDHD